MAFHPIFSRRYSRRRAVRTPGILAGAGLALGSGYGIARHVAASIAGRPAATALPIDHVLIACQDNRSFDTYFGSDPRAGSFGIPAGYTQPDGQGGSVAPHHFFLPVSGDPVHTWQSIHHSWNHGQMDGCFIANGRTALGYYTAADLPYYAALSSDQPCPIVWPCGRALREA